MSSSPCELCEAGPVGIGYLCDECAQRLAADLGGLPGIYADLEEMSLPGARQPGRGGRLIESPALGNLYAADARSGFRVLLSWRTALREDRGLPVIGLDGPSAGAVTAAAVELQAAVPWIAGSWPAAGDFAREIRDLHRGAVSVTGHEPATRLGFCPAITGEDRCGGVLWRDGEEQVIRCRWCSATYPPGIWGVLREEQDVARRERAAA